MSCRLTHCPEYIKMDEALSLLSQYSVKVVSLQLQLRVFWGIAEMQIKAAIFTKLFFFNIC